MKRHTAITFSWSFFFLFLSTACSLDSDPRPWQLPELVEVRVHDTDFLYCYNTFSGLVFGTDVKENPIHLLLRDGDIITAEEGPVIIYRASDGNSLTIGFENGRGTVSGRTVTLLLDGDEEWSWLESAGRYEIEQLRIARLDEEISPDRMPLLEQLASYNPTLSWVVGDGSAMLQILPLFNPVQLWLVEETILEESHLSLLAGEKRTHILAPAFSDEMDLSFLKDMTGLRTLWMSDWNPAETGPLPDDLKQLRSVICWGGEITELSCLGSQLNLEELVIVDTEENLIGISALARHPHLKSLCLRNCTRLEDISIIRGLNELRWLALPSTTTQQKFVEILRDHPELTILEVNDCEGIVDLSPLNDLEYLDVLMVPAGVPMEPLYKMHDLKYLAVQVEGMPVDDEAELQLLMNLRDRLPDTVVVAVAPFCLGSGWILLLIPFGFIAWWMTRSRSERKGSVPVHG